MKAWIWIKRLFYTRGFGIHSPKDYAFVRYVINEHYPYYAYERLKSGDWLTRKLGRLYLRMANWRKPQVMKEDGFTDYWKAGRRAIRFVDAAAWWQHLSDGHPVEMARQDIMDDWQGLFDHCDAQSVVIIEGISRDWKRWHAIEHDSRVGTTFDLYYCGIVFFDTDRYAHHYKINF